jgi:Predicted nucleotide-binding protein containing TIR-like domain
MSDLTLRRNENCIVGMPACNFVFNSTRSCFIAYGFRTSRMELGILRSILSNHQMEVIEACDAIDPGKMAFCTKICSKIITSQFCIILLNLDRLGTKMVPNANVNMEYGLMLGFNKYILPFQRESHPLPFNLQGLDTIRYNDVDFERKARNAISVAIDKTSPSDAKTTDQVVESFLIYRDIFVSPAKDPGEQLIATLINRFGFLLCTSIWSQGYTFLGVFTNLRADAVNYRIRKIPLILKWLWDNARVRREAGVITANIDILAKIIADTKIIIN